MQGGDLILNFKNRKSIRLAEYDYNENGCYFVTICVNERAELLGEIKNGEMILNKYGRIVAQQWLWLEKQYEQVYLDQYAVMPNHFHGIIFIDNDYIRQNGRGGSRPARINGTNVANAGGLSFARTNGTNIPNECGSPSDHTNIMDVPNGDGLSFERTNDTDINNAVGSTTDHINTTNVKNGDMSSVRTNDTDVANANGCRTVPKNIMNVTNAGGSRPAPTRGKIKHLSHIIGAFKTTSSKFIHQNGQYDFMWQRSYYDRIIRNANALVAVRKYIYYNPAKWEANRFPEW